MNILISLTEVTVEEIEKKYAGKGYADFKKDVEEAIVAELEPIQKKVKDILADKAYLEKIYKAGAEKAYYMSMKTLRKMQRKIGLIPPAK